MTDNLYHYRANIVRVVDGDTIYADVDFGFGHIWQLAKFRLAWIDAPEIVGADREAGLAAREWLRGRIEDQDVILQTLKDRTEKYGRYLAVVHLDGVVINTEAVMLGYAKPWGTK